MKYHITLRSDNTKTGPIPVTTSPKATCPPTCPLRDGGCYARGGPLGLHWSKVSAGERGVEWWEFVEKVRSIPLGQVWGHNQAGDLPGRGNAIDGAKLHELTQANRGKRGFTYTHKPMTQENRALVARANLHGFTVNLSADTAIEADELAALGAGPVVVVVPEAAPATSTTPRGRKIVVCPAQQRDDITCKDCGLCAQSGRSVIVGFRAHGSSKRKAEAVCNGGAK